MLQLRSSTATNTTDMGRDNIIQCSVSLIEVSKWRLFFQDSFCATFISFYDQYLYKLSAISYIIQSLFAWRECCSCMHCCIHWYATLVPRTMRQIGPHLAGSCPHTGYRAPMPAFETLLGVPWCLFVTTFDNYQSLSTTQASSLWQRATELGVFVVALLKIIDHLALGRECWLVLLVGYDYGAPRIWLASCIFLSVF